MVLKRLKLHQFLIVWHKLFPMHKHGCRKGAGIFQQKRLFSWFRVIKKLHCNCNYKFHHFCPPTKTFGKIHNCPPGKNPSDAHAHEHVKLHQFCKKLCCITPSGNTVQQHQCGTVSKPQPGDRLCTVYSAKHYEILSNYK